MDNAYVPGVCNINREEIAKRRLIGHIGLALFVITLIVLIALHVNQLVRLVLFLPAMLSASGYLQARNHFCVGYAGAGKQNASEGSTAAREVVDEVFRARDKAKARLMNLQAAGIALAATLIAVILPF